MKTSAMFLKNLLFGLIPVVWGLWAVPLTAQSTSVGNSYLTLGQRAVITFGGNWQTEQGLALGLPFVWEQSSRETFVHPFVITNDSTFPDTLLIYISGWSQRGEVWLNGRLLGVTGDPFGEYAYPVAKSWIREGQNELVARLSLEGETFPHYPVAEVGIFRESALLVPDTVARRPLVPKEVARADSVVIVAPWTQGEGHGVSERWMIFVLQELKARGHLHLHLPFRAPPVFYRLAAELGFVLVSDPMECSHIAWYNEYPVAGLKFQPRFWKDAEGNRTEAVYTFQSPEELKGRWLYPPSQTWLVVLLVIPFLGLAAFRLADPKTFEGTLEYLTKSKIYLDLIQNNKLMKSEGTLLLTLLRMYMVAAGCSAYLYFLQCIGKPDTLNVITSESVLYDLVNSGPYSFSLLFLMSFGVLAVVSVLKYMAVYGTSIILRLNFFPTHIPNLDLFASFPLTPLLVLPAWFIFYVDGMGSEVVLIIWQVILLAYALRRIYSIFQGLGVLYSFPLSLKILYICTLEILPWIFLL